MVYAGGIRNGGDVAKALALGADAVSIGHSSLMALNCNVAREDNLIACFMSKPFMGVSASGCHHNMSLWRGGEDTVNHLGMDSLPGMEGAFSYRVGGENTFMLNW